MKNRPSYSNQHLLIQKQENFTPKEEPKSTLIKPSFYIPGETDNNEFSSNITQKKMTLKCA